MNKTIVRAITIAVVTVGAAILPTGLIVMMSPLSLAGRAFAAPPAQTTAANDNNSARRASASVDLDKLRAEYDRLREELFKARVRHQKVAEKAYRSKLAITFRWKGSPDYVIQKARFLLDGGELWSSSDRQHTDDLIQIAERPVKPGPHALSVRLEVRPKTEAKGGTKTGGEKPGYTSDHTFAIVVPETGRTLVELTGDEDGDPPEYEPELELEVDTEKE